MYYLYSFSFISKVCPCCPEMQNHSTTEVWDFITLHRFLSHSTLFFYTPLPSISPNRFLSLSTASCPCLTASYYSPLLHIIPYCIFSQPIASYHSPPLSITLHYFLSLPHRFLLLFIASYHTLLCSFILH